jgi:general secretion pathway protein M
MTTPLTALWQQRLAPRERRVIVLAAAVIALALLWWIGLSPALRTLRQAGEQRAALQTQAAQMQQLQREAEALRALPRITQAEALRALEAAAQQRLGASAKLAIVGDRATITLKEAPAAALADWLTDARVNARATPVEARLTRSGSDAAVVWSGALTMGLPNP